MKQTLGVCYYPEHWPQERWARDAEEMVNTGLTWVRIGEFAWSKLEPTPQTLDFKWLDEAIDVLGSAGLKVILGTPTATPPRWMIDKHPDMLAVDASGRPRRFGSRRHYCFSHGGYLSECKRITEILAKRYAGNPHIAAWQTDNEYGCHDTTISYSPCARGAFQAWLSQRYQSPNALNDAWGNVFWSMEYTDFGQIDLPNLTVTEPNPSHVMDFRRFSSDQVVRFNRAQTDILRKYSDAPLIHNYMGRETDFDHFDVGADLDIAAWDSYPIGFLSDRLEAPEQHKSAFLRQGDPDFQAFHHDLYRSVGRGRWWVMEQQPGPVNWAPYNPAPLPGMARLWAWEAFAHGAQTVCYFRWRQAPFAQEQMHAGLMRPDGQPAPALAEAKEVAREINELPDQDIQTAQVALVFDYPSQWAWEVQPQGADFDYFRLCFSFYRALRKVGLNVDICSADQPDFSSYQAVFAPGLMTVTQDRSHALQTCSGSIILGPRTNTRTVNFQIPSPLPPAIAGLETTIALTESLPPKAPVDLEGGGSFDGWFEHLEGNGQALIKTKANQPAVVRTGSIYYVAGWPDEAALDRIVRLALKTTSVNVRDLEKGIRIRETQTHRFIFNYSGETATFEGYSIAPAGVLWLER